LNITDENTPFLGCQIPKFDYFGVYNFKP